MGYSTIVQRPNVGVLWKATPIVVASAKTSLPFPPTSAALVPEDWSRVARLDLEVWAAGTTMLTNAELLRGTLHSVTVANDAIESVDTTANTLTLTAHAYTTGGGPYRLTTTGAVPGGLAVDTDYYALVIDTNTIQVAASRANALNGIVIDLTSAGTGTTTIVAGTDLQRVHWHSQAILGLLKDGTVPLTSQLAYADRFDHHERAMAYACRATMSAAVATSIALYPVAA